MGKAKRQRLKSGGWGMGEGAKFLGLSDEQAAVVDLKTGFARAVREERTRRGMTQQELGRMLGSSQSRVAKIEAADRSVTMDLMIRALLKMGISRGELASYISTSRRMQAA
jgi:hypothetical protein